MDRTQSYFVYSPPKSNSNGHGVRDKNVVRATQKVIVAFVESFNATAGDRVQLTLHYDKKNELEKARNVIDKLNIFFGPSTRRWDNAGFEKLDNTIQWEFEKKNILEILNYVEELNDDSYLPLSKYWISGYYSYGKSPEPYGTIMCSIESGRLFVRLNLILPFPIENERCYELLFKFHKSLPFKLNGKHFRRLGPSKRGYGQWKLDEETQKRIDECLTNSKKK